MNQGFRRDFTLHEADSPVDRRASWQGLIPNVYLSVVKFYNGQITKREF